MELFIFGLKKEKMRAGKRLKFFRILFFFSSKEYNLAEDNNLRKNKNSMDFL